MHLKIQKTDSSLYDLTTNYKSIGLSRETYDKEMDIVEKTALPGSSKIGESRLKSGMLTLSIQIIFETDNAYRDAVNELYQNFDDIEYLIDTDNGLRTKVEFNGMTENVDNNVGSILRDSICEFKLLQLNPYWEDNTENSASDSGTNFSISVQNDGAMPTRPIIDVTSTSANESFSIYVESNSEGIQINDLSFGNETDLQDYEIDCINGTAKLGDNELDRNNRIKTNTGFFEIPKGSQTIKVISDSNAAVTVKWRNRYIL